MTKVKWNCIHCSGKSLAAFHSDICPLIVPFSSLLISVLLNFKAKSEYFFLRLFLNISALGDDSFLQFVYHLYTNINIISHLYTNINIISHLEIQHMIHCTIVLNKYMFILPKHIRELSGQFMTFPSPGSQCSVNGRISRNTDDGKNL